MQTADAVLQSTPSSHSHAAEFNRYMVNPEIGKVISGTKTVSTVHNIFDLHIGGLK